MRNRIWTELTQAKHNIEFLSLYSDKQRTFLRYFNISILVFSSGGIMGWGIWDKIPVISCGIIALVSILRLIQPHIIMNDKQISNLDSVSNFYSGYYNKLERLWYDSEHGTIDQETVKSRFFEIKESEITINSLVNETLRTKPKKLIDKSKINSDQYFKRIFNV